MYLDILTPEKTLFSGEVDSVSLPGTAGMFTVLENHASLISSLSKGGTVSYAKDGRTETVVIGGGFAEVMDNRVVVCADTAPEGEAAADANV